jgi:hypothetical protein
MDFIRLVRQERPHSESCGADRDDAGGPKPHQPGKLSHHGQ